MLNIKDVFCDHFLKDFCKKLVDIFIEESDTFDSICNSTLTCLILSCNNFSCKECNYNADKNEDQFCVVCFLNMLNCKTKENLFLK